MVPNRQWEYVVAGPEHKSVDTEADLAGVTNEPLLLTDAWLEDKLVD
jgi:hypothetical protein